MIVHGTGCMVWKAILYGYIRQETKRIKPSREEAMEQENILRMNGVGDNTYAINSLLKVSLFPHK